MFVLSALLFAVACNAAFITKLPTVNSKTYDYVIVGGGLAGNVLGSRLSESGKASVLIIEAGGSDLDEPDTQIPLYGPALTPNRSFNYNYTTIPQPHAGGRAIIEPRGRILGGCSSVNYLLVNKGAKSEWDRLANITGDQGWSYNAMLPYSKKWEKWVPAQDNHDQTNQYLPSAHGTSGPVHVTVGNHVYDVDSLILKATAELGLPYNRDVNSGNAVGLGWLPSVSGGGIRWSSAVAYIHNLKADTRPNFDILLGATVTDLIYTSSTGAPIVSGVSFTAARGATVYSVRANKEVILSAGAFGSPQILMLSGIGPTAALTDLGIAPRVSLPVGSNLQDHPLTDIFWTVNSNDTYDLATQAALNAARAEWHTKKTGVLTTPGFTLVDWNRLSNSELAAQGLTDPSSGIDSPHIERIWSEGAVPAIHPGSPGRFFGAAHAIVTPVSRGTVKLASTDPFAAPIIDLQLYSSPFDRYAMVQAIKTTLALVNTTALKPYISAPAGPTVALTSDKAIDDYVTQGSTTIYHPSSTAPMFGNNDARSVLYANLTVKGVAKLRVVDLSSFPFVPAGHPMAHILAFAERAADLIIASHQ